MSCADTWRWLWWLDCNSSNESGCRSIRAQSKTSSNVSFTAAFPGNIVIRQQTHELTFTSWKTPLHINACEETHRRSSPPVSTMNVNLVSLALNSLLLGLRCRTMLKGCPLRTIKRSSPNSSVWWLRLLFLMSRSQLSTSTTASTEAQVTGSKAQRHINRETHDESIRLRSAWTASAWWICHLQQIRCHRSDLSHVLAAPREETEENCRQSSLDWSRVLKEREKLVLCFLPPLMLAAVSRLWGCGCRAECSRSVAAEWGAAALLGYLERVKPDLHTPFPLRRDKHAQLYLFNLSLAFKVDTFRSETN